jgi:hypothetical protein
VVASTCFICSRQLLRAASSRSVAPNVFFSRAANLI